MENKLDYIIKQNFILQGLLESVLTILDVKNTDIKDLEKSIVEAVDKAQKNEGE